MVNPAELGEYLPIYNPRKNDIFISYAEADLGFVKRLDAAIRQSGRDPWVDWDDIPIESNEWDYIEAGIKEVDSFIFVISPDSVSSEKNRAELKLAGMHHKQLIPILWRAVEPASLPELLRPIPPITTRRGDTVAFDRLAKKIFYMHTHARLQTRVAEWDQRDRLKELLLSAGDLKAIDRWRTQNSNREFQLLLKQLTPLQKEFLEESYKNLDSQRLTQFKFFISYSRRDRAFVQQLYDRLTTEGTPPWVDWENIPVATDWQQEINQGIEAADTVLFVLSHRSLESEFCFKEIAHAASCGRRTIPIVFLQNPEKPAHKNAEEYLGELIQKLQQLEKELIARGFTTDPNFISRYQTVRFGYDNRFEADFQGLWNAIGTDLKLVESHANLERRAQEWDRNKRHPDLLEDKRKRLRAAEKLIKRCEAKEISITPLQREYVRASQAVQRKRAVKIGIILCLISFLIGAGFIASKLRELDAKVSSLEDRRGLDALVVALETGKEMGSGGWLYRFFAPDLPVRTVTALQQEINQLREVNRLSGDKGHKGRVYQVSFSPDGKLLASASEDRNIKLWKSDGTPVEPPLFGHKDSVVSIVFNPGSKNALENGVSVKHQMLASGSYDKTIKLWQIDIYSNGDIRTKLFKTLINGGHTDKIYSVSSDPGGTMLASASSDGTVKLWSWDGELLETLVHGKPGTIVTAVSFSPYGNEIATAGTDGVVKRWTRRGEFLAEQRQKPPILSLSYNPKYSSATPELAFGDAVGNLKLWQTDRIVTLRKHEGAIRRISYSPNGDVIATASDDGTVRLWQAKDGKPLQTLRGHRGKVYRAQFSPDGRLLATAGADDTVKLWTEDGGTLLDSLEGHYDEVLGIDFSPANSEQPILASASADKTVKLWRLDSPIKLLPHKNRVYKVAFRPKDSILASGSLNTIRLWGQDSRLISSVEAHNSGEVSGLSFSPEGLLASAGLDDKQGKLVNTIKLWRLSGSQIIPATKPPTALVELDESPITDIQFVPHPHQALLASLEQNGEIRFWRYLGSKSEVLNKGELVYSVDGEGQLTSLTFNADGTRMLTTSKESASENGLVKLWKLEFIKRGKQTVPVATLLRTLQEHRGDVLDASFSPNGQFATVGADRVVRLWRKDGVLLKVLPKEHTEPVTAVQFSPDGKLLASSSQDNTIKLWTEQGRLITTLRRHRREVSSLSFNDSSVSNSARILASASYDNQVLLWELPAQFDQNARLELLKQGCQIARNYLKQNRRESVDVRNFCQSERFRSAPAQSKSSELSSQEDPPSSLEAMRRGN